MKLAVGPLMNDCVGVLEKLNTTGCEQTKCGIDTARLGMPCGLGAFLLRFCGIMVRSASRVAMCRESGAAVQKHVPSFLRP